MINILDVTNEGKIIFNTTKTLNNVSLYITDLNHEGIVYKNYYDSLVPGINYFIVINSIVIPHLKDSTINFEHEEGVHRQSIKFHSTDLGNYSIIGNSCLCWRVYEKFNIPYNSPTIGNLILNDFEYLRFCEHIETYLDVPTVLGDTKGNEKFREITGHRKVSDVSDDVIDGYPITHHLDVEVHWIHAEKRGMRFDEGNFFETKGNVLPHEEFKNKWERRVKRGKGTEKIFIWSASELFNMHGKWRRKQIIDRFKRLPGKSIFLTEIKDEEYEDENHIVKFIPKWENNNQTERNKEGGLTWNNQLENASIIYDIIVNKFL